MIEEGYLLDEVLGIIDSQCLDMNTICAMLEIDETALVYAFVDRVRDNKEKFGIYDDIMDDEEDSIEENSED